VVFFTPFNHQPFAAGFKAAPEAPGGRDIGDRLWFPVVVIDVDVNIYG